MEGDGWADIVKCISLWTQGGGNKSTVADPPTSIVQFAQVPSTCEKELSRGEINYPEIQLRALFLQSKSPSRRHFVCLYLTSGNSLTRTPTSIWMEGTSSSWMISEI